MLWKTRPFGAATSGEHRRNRKWAEEESKKEEDVVDEGGLLVTHGKGVHGHPAGSHARGGEGKAASRALVFV